MEGFQDTSDNDMSFEFTGPAIVVPFIPAPLNTSAKRDFTTFSDDPSFRPAEQNDRPTFNDSISQQIPAISNYGSDDRLQMQLTSWLQWGIFRTLEAIQFTSNVLRAVYAATIAATMPVAAAKRRLVSITPNIPAPAPLRRVLSSRRTLPRIFRQTRSPSSGHRSTTLITLPRFRPVPVSPFHIPGNFPMSPPRPSNDVPASPTPSTRGIKIGADVTPQNDTNAIVKTEESTAIKSVNNPMFAETAIANDEMSMDDELIDESITPVYDHWSPIKTTPISGALSAHQLASINELQAIRKMFAGDSPACARRNHMSPEAGPTPAEPKPSKFDGLIELTRSPSHMLGQQNSVSDELIGSTRSSSHSPGQETPLSNESIDLARPSSHFPEQKTPLSDELIELTRSSPDSMEQQTLEADNFIQSTHSVPKTFEQRYLGNEELIELSRPSVRLPGQQPSEVDGLIELTRSPPKALGEQPSRHDKLIESTRSLLKDSTKQGSLPTILKISKAQSPGKGLLGQLISGLKSNKKRTSPLRERPNSANVVPKTPSNKYARFLDNPVTRTRKYVKGEAISYPSPHSSRDENSILSQATSLDIFQDSPTQQEQDAMIAEQLMGSTAAVLAYGFGAGSPESGTTFGSSPIDSHDDSSSPHPESNEELKLMSPSPAQMNASDEAPVIPTKADDADPTTPPHNLVDHFQGLNVSARRSSRRTREKDELAEKRRLEQEAIAAEERARKEKQEAEERARKEKAEAEEKARRKAQEEEERKRTALRMPVEKVIQPLSEEWEQKIAAALALAPTKPVSFTSRGTPITRRDIGKVLPQRGTADPSNGWLNDSIIDAYLQAIVDYGNEAAGQKRGETPKFHAFNNFFYNNLRDEGVDKIRRWAKKAKIGGKDLLRVEWVFIPVNVHGNHWTLIAVSPTRKTIEYYDSFHGHVTNEFSNIREWLESELGRDYKEEEWNEIEDPSMPGMGKGPSQLNGSDCGMFTVTTAKMISLGVDPMAVSASDMPMQRKRLVAELIHGGFTDEFKPNIRFE